MHIETNLNCSHSLKYQISFSLKSEFTLNVFASSFYGFSPTLLPIMMYSYDQGSGPLPALGMAHLDLQFEADPLSIIPPQLGRRE